jgi:rod shape determining protein RodA
MVFSLAPHLLVKEIFLWILGLAFFYLGRHLNPSQFTSFNRLLFAFICLLLLLPLVFNLPTRGSRRWLNLGLFSFQPSEITRPLSALFLANTSHPLYQLIPVFLIALQPDLGSAFLSLVLLVPLILYQARLIKISLLILLITSLLTPFAWKNLLHDYQRQRIITFLHPNLDPIGQGYHVIQSKIAIGSGGFLGKGFKKGSQSQLLFLPEKHTDFIFAATVEELGFISVIIILLAYYLLLSSLLIQAFSHQTNQALFRFSLMVAFLIWTQVVINIGMNLGLLPITGITLPFLSIGGTSLVSLLFSLGIAFSS